MGIQLNGITGDITTPGDVGIGGTLTYEDVANVDSIGVITARSGIDVTGGTITGDGSGLTLDDDIASYSGGRVNSVASEYSGRNNSSLIFTTASMNNVNVTRILTDAVGGYIQGECEL